MSMHRPSLDTTVQVNPDEAGIFDLVYTHKNDNAFSGPMQFVDWLGLASEIDTIARTAIPAGFNVTRFYYLLTEGIQRSVKVEAHVIGASVTDLEHWFVNLEVKE